MTIGEFFLPKNGTTWSRITRILIAGTVLWMVWRSDVNPAAAIIVTAYALESILGSWDRKEPPC